MKTPIWKKVLQYIYDNNGFVDCDIIGKAAKDRKTLSNALYVLKKNKGFIDYAVMQAGKNDWSYDVSIASDGIKALMQDDETDESAKPSRASNDKTIASIADALAETAKSLASLAKQIASIDYIDC